MGNDEGRGLRRYETIIATLVGVSALFVSGYTASVQRQQVRAAVWPILEYTTSNQPELRFTVANKGVGPAIVRHVVVTVDGQPVRDWAEAPRKLLGPGLHRNSSSTLSGHVLSAGEIRDVLVPYDDENRPLLFDKRGELFDILNRERSRVFMEICYSSTLGECWTLRSGPNGSSTTETRTCPDRSAVTFEQ